MLDGFKERKEKALRLYDEYKLLREKYDDNISGETLETKRKKIEDDRFLLLVAGEAKSGKSTFINAFLGVDILPMDVKQCTSALIEINYGTDIALTVSYADDRTETISGEEKVREFLKNHAALSDDYRKIPVTTINNEIIIKSQGTVKESEINDLINGVKTDNVYHLSDDEYSRLIREYINEWKDKWQDIVTRINVSYPFTETMRDITVIDSPGVNAAGMVGDITNGFIEKADAIVFVKSLNGQAAESLSFRKFLDSNIMGRSKASLLMALTGKTHKEKHEVHDLEDQLAEMYQESLSKDHLTSVDSKLQLYFHFCKDKKAEEIGGFIKESEFKDAKALWGEAEKDKKEFLRLLEKEANFGAISEMLEKFGVKAHDNRLLEFLNMISGGYETIQKKLEENADLLRKSAEDPGKLKKEIEKKKEEIEEVKLKMHKGVREIEDVYTNNENGIIKSKAEEAFENFKKELSGVSGFDAVEKKTFEGQDTFFNFQEKLPGELIEVCNKRLVEITGATGLTVETIIPRLSPDDFEKIREEGKNVATETQYYEDGCWIFKERKSYSSYSEEKHVEFIKSKILESLEKTKQTMVSSLYDNVRRITTKYKETLKENMDKKTAEYNDLQRRMTEAEKIRQEMAELASVLSNIEPQVEELRTFKGGIEDVIG